MNENLTQKNNFARRMRRISRHLSRGRWYLKDFERIGAKVSITPHCTDMGKRQYLYGCQLDIAGKEYYLIAKKTPFLCKHVCSVNGIKHPGREQQKVAEEVVDYFNEAYSENRNGIRTEIIRRNFYIIAGQVGLVMTWFSTPLLLVRFFFTNMINMLILSGISAGIFILCMTLVFLAKKDSKFGGK